MSQSRYAKKRARRLPASPKALGLATFSLVGLCFGSAAYLAALPNLIVQSPAALAVSEQGGKAVEEVSSAVQGAAEAIVDSVSASSAQSSSVSPAASATASSLELKSPSITQSKGSTLQEEATSETPAANTESAKSEESTDDSGLNPAPTPNQTPGPTPNDGLDQETEKAWRDYYQKSFDNLAVMVDSYNACVSDVNELRFASYGERQAAKARCDVLADDLIEWYKYIINSGIPDNSKYCSARNAQAECYRSLDWALLSIANMWDINLTFQDPEGHEDEFMKPIVDDEVDGVNKYISQFNQYYPSGCPVDE